MNINSSNYWSASNASSRGMSGLVSGMDTENMVKQMLAGTQKKIDAQKGLKTQTTWKQTMYRDIISSVNNFRNKYFNTAFDATSNMNFASQAFFNTMKATVTSGSGVKILSADSSALTGDMKIKVNQLASAAKVESKSDHKVSSHKVSGNPLDNKKLQDAFKKEIKINVENGGNTSTVTVNLEGAKTQDEIVQKVNDALKTQKIDDIKAESDGGRLLLVGNKDAKNKITSIEPSEVAARMTGLGTVKTETNESGQTLVGGDKTMDPSGAISFDVTLDGVTKNIKLDNVDGTDLTAAKLSEKINEKLKFAFGEGVITTKVENGGIQFGFGDKMNGADGKLEAGHSFKLTGVDLNILGVTPGATSNISMGTKLGDLAGVSGGLYEFEINGHNFSFDHNTSVGQMINEINTSGAGVKISYSSMADKFVMESSSTGAKFNIEMKQTTGNLLGAMFGDSVIEGGTKATSDRLTVNHVAGTANALNGKQIKSANISFVVNGEEYTFEMKEKAADKDGKAQTYTDKEFEDKFNEYLKDKFNGDITYDKASGQLKIQKPGYEVNVVSESVTALKGDVTETVDLGLKGKNNFATDTTNISDVLNLTDKEKGALGTGTLGSLTSGDVTFKDGRLTVNSEGAKKLNTLMKDVVIGTGEVKAGAISKGTDAKVVINGVETTRSSNTFTIDGITMELTGVHKGDEEAVIGTSRDIDTIVKGFEDMVKDYNEMLDKIYGYVDAKSEYRDYPPLTDEQKKEMSDREIELWEEKAKTGLLRRDSTVDEFLSKMRTAMYQRPNGAKFALYDIGVETGTYTSKGKLTLDTAKLRKALADDPGAVEQLFLDAKEGLSKNLTDIMKEAANPSSGSPGTLVKLAGAEGYGTEKNNTLTERMKEIETKIKDLEAKYEKEKNRYWKQFNTMEQILANFNNQSAMIQSQFMSF